MKWLTANRARVVAVALAGVLLTACAGSHLDQDTRAALVRVLLYAVGVADAPAVSTPSGLSSNNLPSNNP